MSILGKFVHLIFLNFIFIVTTQLYAVFDREIFYLARRMSVVVGRGVLVVGVFTNFPFRIYHFVAIEFSAS